MDEPSELSTARRHLARAEAGIETEEGLHHLQEGLGLLERVTESPAAGKHGPVARNLGGTYAAKVHEHVQRQLASGRNLPEPALQHAFAVIRAFDGTCFDVPAGARDLKIELVRRLIDIYYEGYSAAERQRAYEELAKATGVRSAT